MTTIRTRTLAVVVLAAGRGTAEVGPTEGPAPDLRPSRALARRPDGARREAGPAGDRGWARGRRRPRRGPVLGPSVMP